MTFINQPSWSFWGLLKPLLWTCAFLLLIRHSFFQEPVITCTLWFLTVLPQAWILEALFLFLQFERERSASGSVPSPSLTQLCQLQQAALCFPLFLAGQASKLCPFCQHSRWGYTKIIFLGSPRRLESLSIAFPLKEKSQSVVISLSNELSQFGVGTELM